MARRKLDGIIDAVQRAEDARDQARRVDGRVFSDYVPEVRRLVKAREDDAAAGLLLRLIEAVEREAAIPAPGRVGVPVWYYSQLAAIYARAGMPEKADATMARHAQWDARTARSGKLLLDALREAADAAGDDSARTVAVARPRQARWAAAPEAVRLATGFVRALGKLGRQIKR